MITLPSDGLDYDTSTNLVFNGVTYSAGSPTGGSVDLSGTMATTANGQTQKYSGQATIALP